MFNSFTTVLNICSQQYYFSTLKVSQYAIRIFNLSDPIEVDILIFVPSHKSRLFKNKLINSNAVLGCINSIEYLQFTNLIYYKLTHHIL